MLLACLHEGMSRKARGIDTEMPMSRLQCNEPKQVAAATLTACWDSKS